MATKKQAPKPAASASAPSDVKKEPKAKAKSKVGAAQVIPPLPPGYQYAPSPDGGLVLHRHGAPLVVRPGRVHQVTAGIESLRDELSSIPAGAAELTTLDPWVTSLPDHSESDLLDESPALTSEEPSIATTSTAPQLPLKPTQIGFPFLDTDGLMQKPDEKQARATRGSLGDFKRLVRKVAEIDDEGRNLFKKIPDAMWAQIFETNFAGNFEFAKRFMMRRSDEIARIDHAHVLREKQKIHGLEKASSMIIDALTNDQRVVFITDFDNDGSLSQAIIQEYLGAWRDAVAGDVGMIKKLDRIVVEYAQSLQSGSRGFNLQHLELIAQSQEIRDDESFVVVTADNGINSRNEQDEIQRKFPNCKIVVTDHHTPEPDMVVLENDRTVIVNPHHKPTPFFEKYNISGADTVGVLMRRVVTAAGVDMTTQRHRDANDRIEMLSQGANLVDYVNCHPAGKPTKDFHVTQFLELQPLLNTNQSMSKMITGEIPEAVIDHLLSMVPSLDSAAIRGASRQVLALNVKAKAILDLHARHKTLQTTESLETLLLKELSLRGDDSLGRDRINPNDVEQLRPLIFRLSVSRHKTKMEQEFLDEALGVFKAVKAQERKIVKEIQKGKAVTQDIQDNSCFTYADPTLLRIFNRKFLAKAYPGANTGFLATLDAVGAVQASGSFRSLYDSKDIFDKATRAKIKKELHVDIETPGHPRAAGLIVKAAKGATVTQETLTALNRIISDRIGKLKKLDAKKTWLLGDFATTHMIAGVNNAIRGNVSNMKRLEVLLQLTPDTVFSDAYTTEQYSMDEIVKERPYGYVSVATDFHDGVIIMPTALVKNIVDSGYRDYLALGYMNGGAHMADCVVNANSIEKGGLIDIRQAARSNKAKALKKAFLGEPGKPGLKENPVRHLSREDLKNNPIFMNSDYADQNFNLYESLIVRLISERNMDSYVVLDVEGLGFGKAPLINIGLKEVSINPASGVLLTKEDFGHRHFVTARGDEYLVPKSAFTENGPDGLMRVSGADRKLLPPALQKILLVRLRDLREDAAHVSYYLPAGSAYQASVIVGGKTETSWVVLDASMPASFTPVYNRTTVKMSEAAELLSEHMMDDLEKVLAAQTLIDDDSVDEFVVYNREIEAKLVAILTQTGDCKVTETIADLTGIDTQLIRDAGWPIDKADAWLSNYLEGKKIIWGAHNTPYDNGVITANMPRLSEVLNDDGNIIYDTALFSRSQHLAYDNVPVSSFKGFDSIPSRVTFYNPTYSDYNLSGFILAGQTGFYPDASGRYVLECDRRGAADDLDAEVRFFMIDKEDGKNSKTLITIPFTDVLGKETRRNATAEDLLAPDRFSVGPASDAGVKYSVQALLTHWAVTQAMLTDEAFDVDLIHVPRSDFAGQELEIEAFRSDFGFDPDGHREALEYFQRNYRFDKTKESNIADFESKHFGIHHEGMLRFTEQFLIKNKSIQQKFSDGWIIERILKVADPRPSDVSKDLVDMIFTRTQLPISKIKDGIELILAYKKKHGLKHMVTHEMHANGPHELGRTGALGDVSVEDIITLILLGKQNYNAHNHSIGDVVKTFWLSAISASNAARMAEQRSGDIGVDMYSARQAKLYDATSRGGLSPMIQTVQDKAKELAEPSQEDRRALLRFRLGADILPPDTSVYAVTRPGAVVTQSMIDEFKEALEFIMVNRQLAANMARVPISADSSSPLMIHQIVIEHLEANKPKIQKMMEKLTDAFDFVEFSNRDAVFKSAAKTFASMIGKTDIPEKWPAIDDLTLAQKLDLKRMILLATQDAQKAFPLAMGRDLVYQDAMEWVDLSIAGHARQQIEGVLQVDFGELMKSKGFDGDVARPGESADAIPRDVGDYLLGLKIDRDIPEETFQVGGWAAKKGEAPASVVDPQLSDRLLGWVKDVSSGVFLDTVSIRRLKPLDFLGKFPKLGIDHAFLEQCAGLKPLESTRRHKSRIR